MTHVSIRRVKLTVACATAVALLGLASVAAPALGATHVTADIKVNTTWGPSGSPYILDKQVKVISGVKLTILPGTVIEFNATSSLTFYIEGSIEALGSAEAPIEFTSSQAAEGKGAPGQYHGVNVLGSSASGRFSFTRFYYGGAGSGKFYTYGALTAQSGSSLLVENSTFERNAYSGIKLAEVSSAKIFESSFKHNGDGISGTAAPIVIAHNTIEENAEYGLYFNWIMMSTQPGAEIENNEIAKNNVGGVYLSGYCLAAPSTFPHGEQNNIYDNGPTGGYKHDGDELRTLYKCEAIPIDWDNNYWGESTSLLSGPAPILDGHFLCETLLPADWWKGAARESGRFLGYSSYDLTKMPPGPISTDNEVEYIPVVCKKDDVELEVVYNIYNTIFVNEYSTEPYVIT